MNIKYLKYLLIVIILSTLVTKIFTVLTTYCHRCRIIILEKLTANNIYILLENTLQ